MERLFKRKRVALILAALFSVIAVASLVVIIISTVNFLYTPLIISIIIFTASDYAAPLFWMSHWDCSRMIKIVGIMQSDRELDNGQIRELMALRSQKYVDKLIMKIRKGGYLN